MALKFLSKQRLRRCVLSFSRLKLKACPNIVSLNGFELKSHFQSDDCQIMQLPSIKNAGFPKRRLSHAICHVVKFPKALKTLLPLPKVFTKVCTYFDVTNLSLFYRWFSKISYPWDFASAPPCACIDPQLLKERPWNFLCRKWLHLLLFPLTPWKQEAS